MNRESGPMGAEEVSLQKAKDKIKSADTEMDKAKGVLEAAEALDKGLDGLSDVFLVETAQGLTKEHIEKDIQKRSKALN